MAVPRLRFSPPRPPANAVSAPAAGPGVSAEAELYHRTYTTLLRSSGETLLRVLEPSHRGMRSSLHPLAAAAEPDLGAFLYATRRLPQGIHAARVIVMGQEAAAFARHGIGRLDDWQVTEAPARRRRWYVHEETFALLLASTSDLDDLIPAGRLPARVEQAPRAARGHRAARARARAGLVRRAPRRRRGRLGAGAWGVGAGWPARLPGRGR